MNLPKKVVLAVTGTVLFTCHVVWEFLKETWGAIFVLGVLSLMFWIISQIPDGHLKREAPPAAVDSMFAGMDARNRSVIMIQLSSGVVVEADQAPDISEGDTVSLYSGNRICKSTVKQKAFDNRNNMPPCSSYNNVYRQR